MSPFDGTVYLFQRKQSPNLIPHLWNEIFEGGCAAGHNVGQGDRADKRTGSPDPRQRPPSFCHRFYPDPLLPFWTFLAKTHVWGAFPAWASRLRVWRARRGRGRRCWWLGSLWWPYKNSGEKKLQCARSPRPAGSWGAGGRGGKGRSFLTSLARLSGWV